MQQRDRRQIRYEDFARAQRKRRWPLIAAVTVAIALAAAAAAYFLLGGASESHTPPPALSQAGKPVANEAYQWKHVAIGGGGMISGLSMDPAGKSFVVRTDVYGGYIWNASENRWSQLVTAAAMPESFRKQNGIATGVYEIIVAPSRPERIYMAVKGRVFRSDDQGRNWAQVGDGSPFPATWNANDTDTRLMGPFMAVDPTNPDLLLLGTPANGLWRSADAGASWTRVASVPDSKPRRPKETAPGALIWFEQPAGGKPTGRIFAFASGSGMFVSDDKGASFRPLGADTAHPLTLQRGAFDRKGIFFGVDDVSKSIWAFKDGAWRDLSLSLGLKPLEFAVVAASPRTDQVVVFERSGAGYISDDGGANWVTMTHSARAGEGDPPWLRVADQRFFTTADVMFDPVVPNRLWVAAGVGVFHADMPPGTGHASWTSQTRGIEELVANDVIQPPGGSPVFAGWDFGTHVKDDLNAYSTTFGPNERALMSVQQLDWTPARPGYLVTNASDARIGCCADDGNAVMAGYSADNGRLWKKFSVLPTPPGTQSDDPWRMSFGTIAVSSNDADNIVWAPAFNRQPFYTTNGGMSWKPVVLNGATGEAPGSFKEFYYQRKTLAADKAQPGVFYLYHSGEAPNPGLVGLWRTRDGGATWLRVFEAEIAPGSNVAAKLRAVPGKAGHLFFTSAFEDISDTQLRRSTDGGENWSLVPNVTRIDDIAFGKAPEGGSYPTIFISGQVRGVYGIWRSIDNAASWQQLVDFPVGALDQVTTVGADPDVFGRVYIGFTGSSWIWGEPAPCRPAPYLPFQQVHCSAVR